MVFAYTIYKVAKIGELLQSGELKDIKGIPTSEATLAQMKELNNNTPHW